MGARLRLWWQYIRQHWLLSIGIIVTLVVLAAFILAVWMFGWNWTGFNGGYSQITTTSTSHGTTITTAKPPGKNLWDLLQLLIIPIVLAIGGFWLNQIQKSREEKTAEQRAEVERKAAEKRAQTEREIASDNQREAALQGYLDKMSELLLEKKLRESRPEDEVRKIASVRTLTVLPRLDGMRKRSVLLFLYEAGLIDRSKSIVDLSAANFTEANLMGANLSGAHLKGVDFTDANLIATNLSRSDLEHASLNEANLMMANLCDAYLCKAGFLQAYLHSADLRGADLRKAYFVGARLGTDFFGKAYVHDLSKEDIHSENVLKADLSGADLSGADLSGAEITQEQLDQTASLKGATMPDGSTHP